MVHSSLQLGNVAGVAWNIANGLAQIGWESTVVELESEPGEFPRHIRLDMSRSTSLPVRVMHFARIVRLARKADIVHFHFGIRPFGRYLRRLCDTPYVVHFHGSDLREGISDGYRDLAAAELISTPDLKKWAPRATWIPNPILIPEYGLRPSTGSVVVGHFPSNPTKKGTKDVVDSIRRLRSRLEFEFRLVSGVSHDRALQEMRQCDVVIDQLSPYGVYGMVSVEAMSLRCVVLSSIDSSYYDHCPIIPVDKESLEGRLEEILSDRSRSKQLGDDGRRYVERVHHPSVAAARVREIYERVR